jgi:hypothetical protein
MSTQREIFISTKKIINYNLTLKKNKTQETVEKLQM